MLGFVVFVIGVLVVGALLFLLASVLMGRGETQPPAELDRSPVELPDDRPVFGDDIRALQMSVAFRGYRMTEVDWLLDQFAQVLDERDAEIAALRAQLHPPADDEENDSASTPDLGEPADEEDPACVTWSSAWRSTRRRSGCGRRSPTGRGRASGCSPPTSGRSAGRRGGCTGGWSRGPGCRCPAAGTSASSTRW